MFLSRKILWPTFCTSASFASRVGWCHGMIFPFLPRQVPCDHYKSEETGDIRNFLHDIHDGHNNRRSSHVVLFLPYISSTCCTANRIGIRPSSSYHLFLEVYSTLCIFPGLAFIVVFDSASNSKQPSSALERLEIARTGSLVNTPETFQHVCYVLPCQEGTTCMWALQLWCSSHPNSHGAAVTAPLAVSTRRIHTIYSTSLPIY